MAVYKIWDFDEISLILWFSLRFPLVIQVFHFPVGSSPWCYVNGMNLDSRVVRMLRAGSPQTGSIPISSHHKKFLIGIYFWVDMKCLVWNSSETVGLVFYGSMPSDLGANISRCHPLSMCSCENQNGETTLSPSSHYQIKNKKLP